ncbi:hypothetical protein NEDG_01311 [Nematocida displodere]|uniref:Uncharacterized protein n=1 Tax=Nematocida displodere TaxID=1805483 RepID=A0A177EBP2_9MICR|nr:hypothetical protein NEDG_01311 [Nematocida displodere]
MIMTLEGHELFESILLSHGLTRGRVADIGQVSVYLIGDRRLISYTKHAHGSPETQQVYVQTEQRIEKASFTLPWVGTLIGDRSTAKEYRVRTLPVTNGTVEGRVFYIESGEVRVITAVQGVDHAQELFEEIDTIMKKIQPEQTPEELLMVLFIEHITGKGETLPPARPEPETRL